MKGGSIALSAQEVRKGLYLASKSVTLATTTTLVEPTARAATSATALGNLVSSIIDRVYVQDGPAWAVPGALRHQRAGRQGRQKSDQRRRRTIAFELIRTSAWPRSAPCEATPRATPTATSPA